MTITLTPEEQSAGEMTSDHLSQAVQGVREDGYLVVENAVDHACLDVLKEKMNEDSHKLMSAKKWGGAGRVKGHLQQGPPLHAPYVFPEIVSNPLAIQVTKGVLGEGVFNSFYNGNTNTPGSGLQPIHRDARPLWPDWGQAHPATTLVVNISPQDVHEHNGSTEIWPGSHLVIGDVTEELVAKHSSERASLRVRSKKGSFVIRDIRLWHRGVPNESDEIRHMIAMVHQIRWFRRVRRLMYQKGCEDAFVSEDLDHNAQFVDGPMDYLFGPFKGHS
ncbi:MAG: phytanoyl-CoA dioxygenase family protein [bacterium]|nr:phytanoyl-CoA dioxygenase family protein [bacterium]